MTLSQQQPQGGDGKKQGGGNIGANGFLIAEQQEREEVLLAKEALVELRAAEVARREREALAAKANAAAATKNGAGDPELELEKAQMKVYKLELQLREALAGGSGASVYASAAGLHVDAPGGGPGTGGGGGGGIVLGGGGGFGGDGMEYLDPQELLALEQELVVQETILKGTQKENELLTAQLKQAHAERRMAEARVEGVNEVVSKRVNEELKKVCARTHPLCTDPPTHPLAQPSQLTHLFHPTHPWFLSSAGAAASGHHDSSGQAHPFEQRAWRAARRHRGNTADEAGGGEGTRRGAAV
jgi:hypothetical protein